MREPPAPGSEVRAYEGRELEAMACAERYRAWVCGAFIAHVGGDVAEVGAGDGAFSALLQALQPRSMTLFEPASELYRAQQQRIQAGSTLRSINSTFFAVADQYRAAFDTVVYNNVLEHIDNEAEELAQVFQALRPGGHLCVFVPACPWLMSEFDRRIGHHRRHTKRSLREALQAAGFAIERLHYFDVVGIIPWFLVMRLGRGDLAPARVRAYDRLVVPWLRRVESRWRPPIGKNLVAVGRKPG